MSGFHNPLIGGGGGLVYPSIHSPLYRAGSAGWSINKDGTAEFNDVTVRGMVLAATIIGALIENASGNPKTSINPDGSITVTNAAGAVIFKLDPTGVMTWYDASGNVLMSLSPSGIVTIRDPAQIEFPTGLPIEGNIANIASGAVGAGAAQYLELLLSGPSTNVAGARDWVQLALFSANDGNTSDANMEFIYVGSNGTPHEYAALDGTGFNIFAGKIKAADGNVSPATPESWHDVTPLQNGFSAGVNNGFTDKPMCRLLADSNGFAMKGTMVTPASGGVTALTFAQTPAGYNPNFGGPYAKFPVTNLGGGQAGHVEIHNNGNMQLSGNFGNSTSIDLTGACWLD